MDLGNFKEAKAAAQNFLASESRLDILVNNAGM
jgi:NAD(P)-dependent dehydrogenase (short-subunit alcohol dehydrogenase family)